MILRVVGFLIFPPVNGIPDLTRFSFEFHSPFILR
jgi:hypothetical protein